MSNTAVRLGFWAAMLSALMFVLFTGCFVVIAVTQPSAEWTTIEDYVARQDQGSQLLMSLAQLSMLVFAILYPVLISSLYEAVNQETRALMRLSLVFATAFSVLVATMYFVQLTAVRLSLRGGQLDGLEQFMQFYPNSGMLALGMLGWTLFLGLSSLFAAPAFSVTRLERVIRAAFVANGIFCLLGGVGFIADVFWLVFITINIGMGGAILVLSFALSLWFHRYDHAAETPAGA